jgi:elongation factor P--(R)-beta-lysine ligase
MDFKPNMSVQAWRDRQALLILVKNFFQNRNVLEVETPILSAGGAPDCNIDFFSTKYSMGGYEQASDAIKYLQTSPEFFMKRLLAAGYPDIYQIAKAFRNGEHGEFHNSEFSILEWYRIGWTMNELMQEVQELVQMLCQCEPPSVMTYKSAFMQNCSLNPFTCTVDQCMQCCLEHGVPLINDQQVLLQDYLDYIFSVVIQPLLGITTPVFVIDWPREQAALAKIHQNNCGEWVADRFELFMNGIELCNGYCELTNAQEQRDRFIEEQQKRRLAGRQVPKLDERFLHALQNGMPDCSGVAVGLDRLFMLALNQKSIRQVMLFDMDNS